MKGTFPVNKFRELETPFYYYDVNVLRETLSCINKEAGKYNNFCVHYAVKANANHKVLTIIRESGLGADCVSGGEIRAAIKAGFPTNKIVYAGVGKTDWEINLGLDYDIFCFNVESVPELEIINELAAAKGKTARVAFRINPNVGAHTHANITTGLAENKFGISMEDMDKVIDMAGTLPHVKFVLHTVNPAANDFCPIYKENTRTYTLLQSANFGTLLQMEVGAMMVGKIVNENAGAARRVQRGEEKGYFAFGGSTVIVLAQKGSAVPEKRIWNYSRLGIETRVRQGETVGTAGRTG